MISCSTNCRQLVRLPVTPCIEASFGLYIIHGFESIVFVNVTHSNLIQVQVFYILNNNNFIGSLTMTISLLKFLPPTTTSERSLGEGGSRSNGVPPTSDPGAPVRQGCHLVLHTVTVLRHAEHVEQWRYAAGYRVVNDPSRHTGNLKK